ncbi:hypothetical protein PVAND_006417 [Polypedilum vanderplanki]|uniref:Cdc23 domain-containing protein n=1 Tax=Polypedilum vanderplanki TaxID=319348 RepID=A0A9J6C3K4_POLVA|nr:hypothetical protein PVAND_006417 [Polypedilum vanderplanki]
MVDLMNFNLVEVKQDLIKGIIECNKRGLIHSSKWLAELNQEFDSYMLAKTYFDCREYDRAAYFTRNSISPVPRFIYLYSMYMAKEKKRLDNSPDNATLLTGNAHLKDLSELMS